MTHHNPSPTAGDFVIGLDLGTTACKAVALTAEAQVLAVASAAYGLHSPQPGWAEQDAEEIWRGAVRALRELAAQLPLADLRGLCLSGAMHSLLPIAADGSPLAPAMTWADQRAASQARALRAGADAQALYTRTGCPLHSIYHPAKVRWWMDNAVEHPARFVALKDFVLYRLAGLWATDIGLASTTGLLDIHQLKWDDEAITLAGVTPDRLPPLVEPETVVGNLTSAAARETGLTAGVPVVAGSSDGGLAILGTGGQIVITVGTSGAVRKIVDRPLLDPLARTWSYVLTAGRWFAGGAINNGGLALQWIQENVYADAGYDQLLADAATVPPGADGVTLLPYFSGERSPHWNPDARALLFGLRLAHTRAHVARAVLEGVAFCLADVWETLKDGSEGGTSAQLTGGVTRAPLWTQIIADVLNLPLAPIEAADASAVGAALLGLEALGPHLAWPVAASPTVFPDPMRHSTYAAQHREFQSLYARNFASTPSQEAIK